MEISNDTIISSVLGIFTAQLAADVTLIECNSKHADFNKNIHKYMNFYVKYAEELNNYLLKENSPLAIKHFNKQVEKIKNFKLTHSSKHRTRRLKMNGGMPFFTPSQRQIVKYVNPINPSEEEQIELYNPLYLKSLGPKYHESSLLLKIAKDELRRGDGEGIGNAIMINGLVYDLISLDQEIERGAPYLSYITTLISGTIVGGIMCIVTFYLLAGGVGVFFGFGAAGLQGSSNIASNVARKAGNVTAGWFNTLTKTVGLGNTVSVHANISQPNVTDSARSAAEDTVMLIESLVPKKAAAAGIVLFMLVGLIMTSCLVKCTNRENLKARHGIIESTQKFKDAIREKLAEFLKKRSRKTTTSQNSNLRADNMDPPVSQEQFEANMGILGINPKSTNEQITSAYRNSTKAGQYRHPDKGGITSEFQKLEAAYGRIKSGMNTRKGRVAE
jgi:hypothetical protein